MVRKYVAWMPADQYVCHLFPTFYEHASSGRVLLAMHENWLQIARYRERGSGEFRRAKLWTVHLENSGVEMEQPINYFANLV
jgi:hypothetical protein